MAKKIIETVIEDAKKHGHDVRVRDVGYAILCAKLEDSQMAYMLIFGDDGNHDTFITLDRIKYLVNYFKGEALKAKEKSEASEIAALIAKNKGKNKNDDSVKTITFEENREGLENQLVEIRALIEELKKDPNGYDPKTMALLIKTEADIRVKLNDKFGAAEKSNEQYIVVQKKFDFICPHTRRECYQMTKDDAMKKWHLIEDSNWEGVTYD